MTIVAAALAGDGCWIGCDGLATYGETTTRQDIDKWLVFCGEGGEWALSLHGDYVWRHFIKSALDGSVPKTLDEKGAREILHRLRQEISSERAHCAEPTRENEQWPNWGASPIIASRLGVWRCCSHLWDLGEAPEVGGLAVAHAAGSGANYALGAMHALLSGDVVEPMSAEIAVAAGVEAACRFDPYCGGRRWYRRLE